MQSCPFRCASPVDQGGQAGARQNRREGLLQAARPHHVTWLPAQGVSDPGDLANQNL
jgi:hypothetical protein